MLPVPVVALPPGVPLKEGLDIDGVVMVGLVARTTSPVPVVALPVGVPVIVGLEIVGLEIVGVVLVGVVAMPVVPVPVVPLEMSGVAAEVRTFSPGNILIAVRVTLIVLVIITKPMVRP